MVLLTGVLLVISIFTPFYILRGVDPEAKEESLKARVPIYGDLHFEGTKERTKGENVGREWDYRSYIYGHVANQRDQYAVWSFWDLPSGLEQRPQVRCEFTLDIYRTTKGEEGKGVFCTFQFESWRFDANNPAQKAKYDKARQEGKKSPDQLAEEYGYYEVRSKEIKDFHTQFIDIPVGVFLNAQLSEESLRASLHSEGEPGAETPQDLDRLRRELRNRAKTWLTARAIRLRRCVSASNATAAHSSSAWPSMICSCARTIRSAKTTGSGSPSTFSRG